MFDKQYRILIPFEYDELTLGLKKDFVFVYNKDKNAKKRERKRKKLIGERKSYNKSQPSFHLLNVSKVTN